MGGTGEARLLARRLVALGYDVTTALAGRTRAPAPVAGRVRRGGFGGTAGLARHLRRAPVDWLIDATHPFATRISAAAREAARATGTRRLRLARPAWQAGTDDHWHVAADAPEAARFAAGLGRRAFITIGARDLAAFSRPGLWCLVRTIDPAPLPGPGFKLILGRGPFTVAGETRILREHAIDVLVTKASGGPATEAKLAAARALGLPVVLIRRPAEDHGAVGLEEILALLKRSKFRPGRARLRS